MIDAQERNVETRHDSKCGSDDQTESRLNNTVGRRMMKTKSRQFSAEFAAIALCVLALGCSFDVPVRLMSWGKMYVTKEGARAGRGGNEVFWNLDWMASSNTPVIAVRMPDGKFLRTDEIRRESFADYLKSGVAKAGGGWDITLTYTNGEVRVAFDDGGAPERIQLWNHARAAGPPEAGPAIRSLRSEKTLIFPMSENDLKEVFGEPTRDETVMHNT